MPTIEPNVKAYLDMLAWSEGTSTSRYTKHDGYDVVVGGINSPDVFRSFADHPGILVTVNAAGLKSTAAGRYQLLKRYWLAYRDLLGLPDFSPASQDWIAVQQIKEQRALDDVKKGRIASAIKKCSNIWASLPGNTYGQLQHPLPVLLKKFEEFGGVLA